MTHPHIDPPPYISAAVAEAIEDSNDRQLRGIIHYAQQLLQDHPSLTEEIEAREGEELVRVEEHEGYTLVVVKRPDESGDAHGPFAYRVSWEPSVDNKGGQFRWHYLGQVEPDVGGR